MNAPQTVTYHAGYNGFILQPLNLQIWLTCPEPNLEPVAKRVADSFIMAAKAVKGVAWVNLIHASETDFPAEAGKACYLLNVEYHEALSETDQAKINKGVLELLGLTYQALQAKQIVQDYLPPSAMPSEPM